MIARITRLRGFKGIIAGRDLADVLKDGHVYNAREVGGVIILQDLGEHAEMDGYAGAPWSKIIRDGTHCFTKEEAKKND